MDEKLKILHKLAGLTSLLASLLRRALYPQYEFYFKQMARSNIGQTNWNFDFDFDSDGLFGNADEPDPYCSVLKKMVWFICYFVESIAIASNCAHATQVKKDVWIWCEEMAF